MILARRGTRGGGGGKKQLESEKRKIADREDIAGRTLSRGQSRSETPVPLPVGAGPEQGATTTNPPKEAGAVDPINSEGLVVIGAEHGSREPGSPTVKNVWVP